VRVEAHKKIRNVRTSFDLVLGMPSPQCGVNAVICRADAPCYVLLFP
jgi:hypothetical protein